MAIQNLRDKLLKAGLVDKKQKVLADTQDRREKKQRGADELAAAEAEKQRLFAEKQAQEAEERRQAELAKATERAEREAAHRVRNICDRWAVRVTRPGQRRFYFVQRSGRVGYLWLPDALCDQLCLGALAIIERMPSAEIAELASRPRPQARKPRSLLQQLIGQVKKGQMQVVSEETHVLLAPEPAERILAIDPSAVRFWARSQKPLGYVSEAGEGVAAT
ncbi:MAG: DUF2058 family protein [Myxococcales bacterium]|jgi:hypothetical protein|nr:DUF2058 family protein [Myxococcales bacterium]